MEYIVLVPLPELVDEDLPNEAKSISQFHPQVSTDTPHCGRARGGRVDEEAGGDLKLQCAADACSEKRRATTCGEPVQTDGLAGEWFMICCDEHVLSQINVGCDSFKFLSRVVIAHDPIDRHKWLKCTNWITNWLTSTAVQLTRRWNDDKQFRNISDYNAQWLTSGWWCVYTTNNRILFCGEHCEHNEEIWFWKTQVDWWSCSGQPLWNSNRH